MAFASQKESGNLHLTKFVTKYSVPECVQSSFKRMKYIADQCQGCLDCGYSHEKKKSCLECEINYKMPDMGYSTPDVDYIKPDFAFSKSAEYENLGMGSQFDVDIIAISSSSSLSSSPMSLSPSSSPTSATANK